MSCVDTFLALNCAIRVSFRKSCSEFAVSINLYFFLLSNYANYLKILDHGSTLKTDNKN